MDTIAQYVNILNVWIGLALDVSYSNYAFLELDEDFAFRIKAHISIGNLQLYTYQKIKSKLQAQYSIVGPIYNAFNS